MTFAVPLAVVARAEERLPTVVVEGERIPEERRQSEEEARQELERIPGGVDLIPQPEIERSRAANLEDALEFTPGVLVRPRFGAADESQLSIRGSGLRSNFHLRGINLLLDGFPYGNADGFADFESLELLAVKRIEVIKAANALRFGGNSLGGAINLVSKTGYDEGLLGLRSEGGSFGFMKHHGATGRERGPHDLYLSYTDTELDGFRDHAEQVRRRAVTSWGYAFAGGATLRVDGNLVRSEEELPGALTRAELERDPRQRNPDAAAQDEGRNYTYSRGAFTLRTPLGPTHALAWATQVNYQNLDHPLAFAVIDDDTYSWSSELRDVLSAPLLGRGNQLTVGLQYFATRQVDRNLENRGGRRGPEVKDQLNQATNVGLYAEDQLAASDELALIAGGRLQWARRAVDDHFLVDGDATDTVDFLLATPKLGLLWTPREGTQVFANASRMQEAPLLLELTAPGQLGADLSALDEQTAWQFELGTRGRLDRRLGLDVAVYDIELWDEIQNVNVLPFPGASFTIPRYRNIDRSRHTGVEVGADVLLGEGLVRSRDGLFFRTAYTWSRFVFVDDERFGDRDLPGAPEHFLVSELRYEHPSGFWLAPGMEAVPAGYFADSANTATTDAYALANVRLGHDGLPWNLRLFFEARNLADVTYVSSLVADDANRRFFEPGDGRAFYGGLQLRWR